jgi:ribulose-phosphate 3-epimerase
MSANSAPKGASRTAISASIAAADLGHLARDVGRLAASGVDLLHVDIADGAFTPLFTFGPSILAALRDGPPIDVHILALRPERLVARLVELGAARISVQIEASLDPAETLAMAREAVTGRRVALGVGLGLDTPLDALTPLLGLIDHVLLLAIRPGSPGVWPVDLEERVVATRRLLDASDRPITLDLDGGVTVENLPLVRHMPVDVVVTGTALFAGGGPKRNVSVARKILGS